jgi:hypothetical protein
MLPLVFCTITIATDPTLFSETCVATTAKVTAYLQNMVRTGGPFLVVNVDQAPLTCGPGGRLRDYGSARYNCAIVNLY